MTQPLHETPAQSPSTVSVADAANALQQHFGIALASRVEAQVYAWMQALAPAYAGCLWEYRKHPNGALYMVPTCAPRYDVAVPGTNMHVCLTADATGLIATKLALETLECRRVPGAEPHAIALTECACAHPEFSAFWNALTT